MFWLLNDGDPPAPFKTIITQLFDSDVYLHFLNPPSGLFMLLLFKENQEQTICLKFFSLVGHQHLSIWKSTECLKAETARVTGGLLQLERGEN